MKHCISYAKYMIPLVEGTENVKKYLIEELETMRKNDWWNDTYEQDTYLCLNAINALNENMCEELKEYLILRDAIVFTNNEPIIYDIAINYDINEPILNGYTNDIIKSTDEMFKAIETGLINFEGKHLDIILHKDRENIIRNNIIIFFKNHPDGIIRFS